MYNNKEKGFTLIEMILVMGLLAGMTVLNFSEKQAELDQMKAKTIGRTIAEYNHAVGAWIANNPGATSASKEGTSWLKNSSCGGEQSGSVQYLPCSFPEASPANPLPFGDLQLSSEIVNTGSELTVTTTSTPFRMKSSPRSDLAGLASITAAGSSVARGETQTASTSFTANPSTAELVMVASNAANSDTWLRVDGANTMNGSITFDTGVAATNREIINLSRIQSFASEVLYLGKPGGATSVTPDRVRVDADQEILGTLVVTNQRGIINGIEVKYGDITTPASVRASRMIDNDDISFVVDPSAQSKMKDIELENLTATTLVKAPNVEATLRLTTREANFTGGYAVNASCSPNGMVSRSSTGQMVTCYNGTWRTPSMFYTNKVTSGESCDTKGTGSFAIGVDGKLYVCK